MNAATSSVVLAASRAPGNSPTKQALITRYIKISPRLKTTILYRLHDDNEDDDEDGSEDEDESDDESDYSSHDSEYGSDGITLDVDKREHRRKIQLFKMDADGRLLWRRKEFAYTRAEFRRRGKYDTMIFLYERASLQELRKYVLERQLPDPYPKGVTLKYYYLRLLDEDDRTRSFRFLDLPPEMRNLIYVELLGFDICHCSPYEECGCECPPKMCHTAIMRTNKMVYKEAKDVLYSVNPIKCEFAVHTDLEYIIGRYTKIHNQAVSGNTRINCVYWGMETLPDWLHRIQHLRIDIDAHGMGASGSARGFLQGCILNLASFLLEEHSLKKLDVHIVNHIAIADDAPEMTAVILYPLRRLSGLAQVSIAGDVDAEVSRSIAVDMQRPSETVFNTVPHLYSLRSEAISYLNLVEAMDPSSRAFQLPTEDGVGEEWDGCKGSRHISWLLEETRYGYDSDDDDHGEFADAEAEANLRRKMEDLKKCLDRLPPEYFEARRENLVQAKTKRQALASKQQWNNVDGDAAETKPKYGHSGRKWKSRLKGDSEDSN